LCLSYSYELPLGKGRLRGGWQTFGIWTFQTGRPFTAALLPDLDQSNTGISTLGFGANDRPNIVGNPAISHPGPDGWFNTTAFALPPFGSFGNAGRNTLTGPGDRTMDVSLVKNTVVGEHARLQFRAEAFNLGNHMVLGVPGTSIAPSYSGGAVAYGSAGVISSITNTPRELQLAMKFLF